MKTIYSKIKNFSFLILIFLALVLGLLLPIKNPTGLNILNDVSWIFIFLLFFLYGLRISPKQTLEGIKNYRLHLIILGFTFIVFPILTFILTRIAGNLLTKELITGFLFLGVVSSTVQSSILLTGIAKGNISAAVISSSISNILGMFLTPLLVFLFFSRSSFHFGWNSVLKIFIQILFPFILAQFLRPWLIEWISRNKWLTKLVDKGSVLLIVYKSFCEGKNMGVFSILSWSNLLTVIILCLNLLLIVLYLTWAIGGLLGFSIPDRKVIVFCGSKKSLSSGFPIALNLFPASTVAFIAIPLMLFHLSQLIVGTFLAEYMGKHTVSNVQK